MRSSGFDQTSIEIFNRRFKGVTLIAVVFFSILVMRLWFLQIVNGPNYRTKSENNRIHLQDIPSFRGMIFDRNGELLVDNRPSFNLYMIPEENRNRDQLLQSLKALIGVNPESVNSRMKMVSMKGVS